MSYKSSTSADIRIILGSVCQHIWFSECLNAFLFSGFIEDVGASVYEEISGHFLNGLTPEDLQPQFQHMIGTDHLETCYLIFNLDQETTC